ncbi:MAG TPA: hypothetical protein VMB50_11020 [Myxococcales bacterium]|nr:hypothetical protein [Myxococcales bacterium]
MAPKTTQPNAPEPSTFEAELTNLLLAVEVNLPADASLSIAGKPHDQAAILSALDGYRELFAAQAAARARRNETMADRSAAVAEARLFVRTVKRELTRRIDPEAAAAFERDPRLPRKAIAAARGAATREIRGMHLRKRPSGMHRRRVPWVH